jgi:hypothetical protein
MKYFNDINTFGLDATCRLCGVMTHFTGQNRYRLEENGINVVKYVYEYQCQDCGKLKMAEFDDANDDFQIARCNCGGQFRRDKPIFCPSCLKNKTDLNKSEN